MAISRRRFLATAGALPLLTSFGAPLWAAAPLQKLLVLVYLKGGNDAYNSFVPVSDARYYRLRPTLSIAREQTLLLNEHLGLNAAMRALLPAWASQEMAILQGIGQQEITNQHYRDLEMQFTAAGPEQYYTEGWVTRALVKNALKNAVENTPQDTVQNPAHDAALNPAHDAVQNAVHNPVHNPVPNAMQNPASEAAQTAPRNPPAGTPDTLDALAFGDLDIRVSDPMGPFRGDALRAVQVQQTADWFAATRLAQMPHLATRPAEALAANFTRPASPTPALTTQFPSDAFAQALRATVELAAAGLAPTVVHITLNADDADQHHAFDCHWKQADYHGAALARLANGLAAFRAGMREIGAWDNTLVATYDEFGRSPKENADHGTHHGWASTHLLLGGRVKGGLYGKAPPSMDVYNIDGPPPVIDYRELYTTVIESWWGGKADGVFARRFKPLALLRA